MLDILLAQIGLDKAKLQSLGENLVNDVRRVDMRLERIEKALGITEPLPDPEASNGEGENHG